MATFEISTYKNLLPFLEQALSSSNNQIKKLVALGNILNFLFVQVTPLPDEMLEHYSTMADRLIEELVINGTNDEADFKAIVNPEDGFESEISWFSHPGLTDIFIESVYRNEYTVTMKLTIHPDKVEITKSEY